MKLPLLSSNKPHVVFFQNWREELRQEREKALAVAQSHAEKLARLARDSRNRRALRSNGITKSWDELSQGTKAKYISSAKSLFDEWTKAMSPLVRSEHIAHKAGFKSPHVVLMCNAWKAGVIKAGNKLTVRRDCNNPEIMEGFERAVKEFHDNGAPIRLISYDWGISADDLMDRITKAIKQDHPDVLAQSFAILCPVKDGPTIFLTKDHCTGLSSFSPENLDPFWSKLSMLLSCTGPTSVESGFKPDRSTQKVCFLGDTHLYGKAGGKCDILMSMIGGLFWLDVDSHPEHSPDGQRDLAAYFDIDRYNDAVAVRTKMHKLENSGFGEGLLEEIEEKYQKKEAQLVIDDARRRREVKLRQNLGSTYPTVSDNFRESVIKK